MNASHLIQNERYYFILIKKSKFIGWFYFCRCTFECYVNFPSESVLFIFNYIVDFISIRIENIFGILKYEFQW